jgi:two-component system, OmpR family, sensor histidine kinase KdpD
MKSNNVPIMETQAAGDRGVGTAKRVLNYAGAVLACLFTAGIARLLMQWVDPTNIVMLFLLAVFLVAWLLGRGPALLAAFLAVALFDFFFVQPHFSFAVADAQHLITFAVMLAVALITGQFAAVARERLRYMEMAQETRMQAEAERLRHSILASLSHDLRTPLAALVGLADTLVLAQPSLPPPHGETVRALRDQALSLAEMVNNLLELARLTQGKQPLNLEWQPLEEIVGAAIQRLGPVLKTHPLSVALDPALPLLEFDAVLLERVLGNLLDNAAKHTPPGTPVVIEARVRGEAAEVSVRDSGPGFPPDAESGAAAHNGLGLSICQAIVAAHGGKLWIGSGPDGGARVSFTLPLGTPPVIGEEAEAA